MTAQEFHQKHVRSCAGVPESLVRERLEILQDYERTYSELYRTRYWEATYREFLRAGLRQVIQRLEIFDQAWPEVRAGYAAPL